MSIEITGPLAIGARAVVLLLSTFVSASAMGQPLIEGNAVTGAELGAICESPEVTSSEYCDGYIAIFAHVFKIRAASESDSASDASYGDGFEAAEVDFEIASESCPDCDGDAIEAVLDLCLPNDDRDKVFCAAYNTGLDFLARTRSRSRRVSELPDPGRDRGADAALADLDRIMFTWLSDEIPDYLEYSCVRATTSTLEIRNAFLRFIDENPADRDSIALIALAKTQFDAFCG